MNLDPPSNANTPGPALAVIGNNLRDRRKSLGLSQRRLAELAGTTQTTIALIENGKGNPTYRTLEGIASVMHSEVRIFLSVGRS